MGSDSMTVCSSSSIAILISSSVMQSGVSVHDYCTDGNEDAWDFIILVCLMVVSG